MSGLTRKSSSGSSWDEVADPDELRAGVEFQDLALAIVRGQVDPADDARQERVAVGQPEDPSILLEVVLGLDEDRRSTPVGADQGLEVRGQVVAADVRERGASSHR